MIPLMVTTTLEKIRFAMESAFTDEFLLDCPVETIVDETCALVRMRVRGFLWGNFLDNKKVKYPKNWVQAFRERFFPGWILKRWPVKYHTEWLRVAAIYPDYKFAPIPGHHTLVVCSREESIP